MADLTPAPPGSPIDFQLGSSYDISRLTARAITVSNDNMFTTNLSLHSLVTKSQSIAGIKQFRKLSSNVVFGRTISVTFASH